MKVATVVPLQSPHRYYQCCDAGGHGLGAFSARSTAGEMMLQLRQLRWILDPSQEVAFNIFVREFSRRANAGEGRHWIGFILTCHIGQDRRRSRNSPLVE